MRESPMLLHCWMWNSKVQEMQGEIAQVSRHGVQRLQDARGPAMWEAGLSMQNRMRLAALRRL